MSKPFGPGTLYKLFEIEFILFLIFGFIHQIVYVHYYHVNTLPRLQFEWVYTIGPYSRKRTNFSPGLNLD